MGGGMGWEKGEGMGWEEGLYLRGDGLRWARWTFRLMGKTCFSFWGKEMDLELKVGGTVGEGLLLKSCCSG